MRQKLQLSRLCSPLTASPGEFRGEQELERRGQFARDRVVVADQQPLEEDLVELPAQLGAGQAVGAVAVTDQAEGVVERAQHGLQSGVGVGEVPFGLSQLAADPGLFGLQQVDRDGPGIEGLQQLVAFTQQLLVAHLLPGSLTDEVFVGALELDTQLRPQLVGDGPVQADRSVLGLDQVLD